MPRIGLAAFFIASIAVCACAQKNGPAPKGNVYLPGPGINLPEFVSSTPFDISAKDCPEKQENAVVLFLTVLATGKPSNLFFIKPQGNDLDKFAFLAVQSDQFKPGTYNGVPVEVAQSVTVTLSFCKETVSESGRSRIVRYQLLSQPEQSFGVPPAELAPTISALATGGPSSSLTSETHIEKVGGHVSAPVPILQPEAEFSAEAKRAKYQGVVIVSLIVDAQGMPQNIRVVQPLGLGLDALAVEAAHKYRFKPTMKNGEPVPVMVNIEVNFRLY